MSEPFNSMDSQFNGSNMSTNGGLSW